MGAFAIPSSNVATSPETVFLIEDDEGVLQTYAYCNLHGLWKSDK